jgi:predicted methyltransferase
LIVLSHYQANQLIQAKGKVPCVEISPDLGLTEVTVFLKDVVVFPEGRTLSWKIIAEIASNENKCFYVENEGAAAIQEYSESFGLVYTLYPTPSAPTMLVSGIPMHRIKDTNPWQDTLTKIKVFGRVEGHILDTTTGLGYTAIIASERADRVTTVELDPAAQEIAKRNPWSQPLFNNPKITQVIGDSNSVIHEFGDGKFSGIVHDPPMFSLAGDLYSLDFYRQAFRVLKPRGRMFHYIGNPESVSGKRVTRGVIQRLEKAGFSRVVPKPTAFGVVVTK